MSYANFEARITRFKAESAALAKKGDRIALLRLLVVLLVGLASWQLGEINLNYLLGTIPGGILVFAVVIRWHDRVQRKQDFADLLTRLNEEEINRLAGKLTGLDGGKEFADPTHPYSSDLDLFGDYSLFQLLGRNGTGFGREVLAEWLTQKGSEDQILARQSAVAELTPDIEWRQNFHGTGVFMDSASGNPEDVRTWIHESLDLPFGKVFDYLSPVLPILLGVNIALSSLGIIPGLAVLAQVIIHIVLNRKIGEAGEKAYGSTERRAKLIRGTAALIGLIEGAKRETPALIHLQDRLKTNEVSASDEIKKFSTILTALEYRLDGTAHFILSTLFLWDAWWLVRLRNWKNRHAAGISEWFRVVGEMEALCGFAATAYARPDWIFPEIAEADFELVGEKVGHPLLPVGKGVPNLVSMRGKGVVWLITGSNMAGKSTYLRTIGINIVLAQAGAPVNAQSFRLTPVQMVSSMRTSDSIEESTSSFYAELKRLKMVIETAEGGGQVFFLLDEILKGTNSVDRHAGAMALVRQLNRLGATGMVSTHDLELAVLENELPGSVFNYSFHCDVTTDYKLHFDYTLRPGVCTSMNATALMKGIGIEMGSN